MEWGWFKLHYSKYSGTPGQLSRSRILLPWALTDHCFLPCRAWLLTTIRTKTEAQLLAPSTQQVLPPCLKCWPIQASVRAGVCMATANLRRMLVFDDCNHCSPRALSVSVRRGTRGDAGSAVRYKHGWAWLLGHGRLEICISRRWCNRHHHRLCISCLCQGSTPGADSTVRGDARPGPATEAQHARAPIRVHDGVALLDLPAAVRSSFAYLHSHRAATCT